LQTCHFGCLMWQSHRCGRTTCRALESLLSQHLMDERDGN
jgi:hypothetical protein